MRLPPAVIVHGIAEALMALAPGLPVTLVSAPGAGVFAGVGWWQALMATAQQAFPDANLQHMLDCGEAPGRALQALRGGQQLIVLSCEKLLWDDLAERANRTGSRLFAAPPVALDLDKPGAARHLIGWLNTDPDP